MADGRFAETFEALTSNSPFPWQIALYERFVSERGDNIPASCNLPTGLGKTSVIAVWLIALAFHPDKMPRRLVYVVNRRTVVDQTTDEVEKYRKNIEQKGEFESFRKEHGKLAVSTLRGQFADNREWSADPSRPAVICGTVDMIGSRLLFSGYGVGFKGKPLHAGFLGQDALLVHDEAHLEPAFQRLIEDIECEQRDKERSVRMPWSKFRVMALTATSRASGESFPSEDERKENESNPEVLKRIGATKKLTLHRLKNDDKLAEEVAAKVLTFESSNAAILVFVLRVADVQKVMDKLPKGRKQQLTGTIRGLERDRMANPMIAEGCPIFARFLPLQKEDTPEKDRWKVKPTEGTVYLVCTSAGEVGVNISADHLVSDLTTFESMAQRFGRVNRFGRRPDTEIHVYVPNDYDAKDEYDTRRQRTKELLDPLVGQSASPQALGDLDAAKRIAAFAPLPVILPTSDILFDAWALTTIRDKLPGRPKVEPYLHGVVETELPETHVAWRWDVSKIKPKDEENVAEADKAKKRVAFEKYAAELLEDYPLKPHELLRKPSYQAVKDFAELTKRHADLPAWIVGDDDEVTLTTIGMLADTLTVNGKKVPLVARKTVLLPPEAGGLESGQLDGSAKYDKERSDYDVADEWRGPDGERLRKRDKGEGRPLRGWRLVRSVVLKESEDDGSQIIWRWLVKLAASDEADAAGQSREYELTAHNEDARDIVAEIVKRLGLEAEAAAVVAAAGAHDLGKDRLLWQRSIGNRSYPTKKLAKSGHRRPPEQLSRYRHEFGSLLDVEDDPAFKALASEELRELCRHLIAAHHGRARPHFPPEEAFDQERTVGVAVVPDVPRRFARLQRKYGRWGLAYLESLVRAADILASKKAEGGES